jgi:hypothetical protein
MLVLQNGFDLHSLMVSMLKISEAMMPNMTA